MNIPLAASGASNLVVSQDRILEMYVAGTGTNYYLEVKLVDGTTRQLDYGTWSNVVDARDAMNRLLAGRFTL